MGYDVTCADGSDMMLRHFRRNARMLGLAVDRSRCCGRTCPTGSAASSTSS